MNLFSTKKASPSLATQLGQPEPSSSGPGERMRTSPPSTGGGGLAADLDELQRKKEAQDLADWRFLILACGSSSPPGIESIALELARLGRTGKELESAVAKYKARLALAVVVKTGEAVEGELLQVGEDIRAVERELAEVESQFAARLDPLRARRMELLATQSDGLEARRQLIAGGDAGDEGDPGKIQTAFETERGNLMRLIEVRELKLTRSPDEEHRLRFEAEIAEAREQLAAVDQRKADWLAGRKDAEILKLTPENF